MDLYDIDLVGLLLFAAIHLVITSLIVASLARRVIRQRALERAWRLRLHVWARIGGREREPA